MTATIFDRPLARRRLARARAAGYVDFFAARAAEEAVDRLSAVNRTFDLALDLGSPDDSLARALRATGKVGRLVRAAPLPGPGVDCVADEEALPFGPERFDLCVSVMALHTVNDLPGALLQIRRALKPDGLFLAGFPGGATLKELRQALTEAEIETTGGAGPRVLPFVDVREAGMLLQRAGFALPVADAETLALRYRDPLALIGELRATGSTNVLIERDRRPLSRATLGRMLERYADIAGDPDGRVRATLDMIWLLGWAPHESQQKPLRPGSATARLADALNTREIGAGEKPG